MYNTRIQHGHVTGLIGRPQFAMGVHMVMIIMMFRLGPPPCSREYDDDHCDVHIGHPSLLTCTMIIMVLVLGHIEKGSRPLKLVTGPFCIRFSCIILLDRKHSSQIVGLSSLSTIHTESRCGFLWALLWVLV